MEEITLGPGEILFNKNEIDTKIFFLLKGKLEFFDIVNEKEYTIS